MSTTWAAARQCPRCGPFGVPSSGGVRSFAVHDDSLAVLTRPGGSTRRVDSHDPNFAFPSRLLHGPARPSSVTVATYVATPNRSSEIASLIGILCLGSGNEPTAALARGTLLLAGWGFGRNGPQCQVRTTCLT